MALRSPPLLEPYLRLPREETFASSLILLSGVLGAGTNWLLHRYLATHLLGTASSDDAGGEPGTAETAARGNHASVVLVSFMRDYAFWKDGCRRLGLDIDAATGRQQQQQQQKASFVFVDGLTRLFIPPPPPSPPSRPSSSSPSVAVDGVGGAGVGAGPEKVLLAPTIDHLRRTLEDAVAHLQTLNPGTRTLLVIDQPDILLAAAGDAMSGQALRDVVLDLREKVHACIITVSADEPFIAAQSTRLEKEHASLALSLAHDAQLVISLRTLDTGTANDVSGVIRVTSGGDDEITSTSVEDRELLYFIRGDGSVRVFERGQ